MVLLIINEPYLMPFQLFGKIVGLEFQRMTCDLLFFNLAAWPMLIMKIVEMMMRMKQGANHNRNVEIQCQCFSLTSPVEINLL